MPPEENTNKNNLPLGAFRVGIDPVFKGNPVTQTRSSIPGFTGMSHPVEAGGAYDVLNNQKYVPSASPVPLAPKQTATQNSTPKSIIRTYKGDLESAVEANHLSSINIAIAENEKMHNQIKAGTGGENYGLNTTADYSDYSKSKIIIFISFIFILAGGIGLGITFFIKNPNLNIIPVVQSQEWPSLITAEIKAELDTNTVAKGKFIITLSDMISGSQIPINNFYNISITTGTSTKRLLSSAELVTLLNFKMPDLMKRTLSTSFMIGVYSQTKNTPFLILKTTSSENTYAGMLAWEKDLEDNFKILFKLPGYEKNVSLNDLLGPTVLKKFEDAVIINKDVRLLRDADKQIILLYSLIDKETVVITTDTQALKDIIARLNKEKTLKR
jgi:hypothetical protein